MERLMRTERVAEALDVSPREVRRMLADGRLRAVRVGRLTRIPESVVARLIRDLKARAKSQAA